MKKFIITTILILSTIASVFAEERTEFFGNCAVMYDTECNYFSAGDTEEEVIDAIKYSMNNKGYDCKETQIYGVFLTEEDLQLFRKLEIPLTKAMKPAEDYKAEKTKTDSGKALYRAEELALHGYWNVTLWEKKGDSWSLYGFILYKGCESGVGRAIKYFTMFHK